MQNAGIVENGRDRGRVGACPYCGYETAYASGVLCPECGNRWAFPSGSFMYSWEAFRKRKPIESLCRTTIELLLAGHSVSQGLEVRAAFPVAGARSLLRAIFYLGVGIVILTPVLSMAIRGFGTTGSLPESAAFVGRWLSGLGFFELVSRSQSAVRFAALALPWWGLVHLGRLVSKAPRVPVGSESWFCAVSVLAVLVVRSAIEVVPAQSVRVWFAVAGDKTTLIVFVLMGVRMLPRFFGVRSAFLLLWASMCAIVCYGSLVLCVRLFGWLLSLVASVEALSY